MALLRKPALLDRIIAAIKLSGWDVIILSSEHPFRLSIFRGENAFVVLCYIWNLTHGGYPRNPNELRIQVTGIDQFRIEENCKTLVLGWSEDERMFAGFDVTKHLISMEGRSPSFQIRRETLRDAKAKDFFPQLRDNAEIAVAFRPQFFVTYAQGVEQFHNTAQHAQDIKALEEIAKGGTQPQAARRIIRDIPVGERKTTLQAIQRKVRDARFRENILAAYGDRCAVSDIQLDLLDAAHIIPVEHERGTDETKNGLCLSVMHHRAFDHCLIGVKRDYSIVFNEDNFKKLRAIGWQGGEKAFRDGCRDKINLPAKKEFYPDPEYLAFGQRLRGWIPRHLS